MDKEMKYSIVMPYYDRSEQLSKTLLSFSRIYTIRNDYEIIIIEDPKNHGILHDSLIEVRDKFTQILPVNIRIIPFKPIVYNPAPLWNLGVKHANGVYIILNNPECMHKTDILNGFDQEFKKDSGNYIVCACEAHNRQNTFHQWYQHSKIHNTRYHWCTSLSIDIFKSTGGFDERFNNGYAFEDDAFREMLINENIPFVLRDDLIVIHQWHHKHTPPDRDALWLKNKKLYESIYGHYEQ